MMKSKLGFLATFLATAALISACAVQGTPPPAFDAQPIAGGKWNTKADNLYIIMDASSSMDEGYKFETAKSVVANFNQTMPELDLMVALRTFGHDPSVSNRATALMAGPQAYNAAVLSDGLAKVGKPGGFSPLGRALNHAAEDLKSATGPIAMIIVSDGLDIADAPLAAAKALSEQHAGALCIYTVQVGDSPAGQSLLAQIAQVTDCGKAVTAGSLASGAAMNTFVKDVLLAGMMDSDGDGVPDDKDRCPNTPSGVKVDKYGCPLDSDKDGVPDYLDKCPGTAPGTKVDADGCPIPTLGKKTVRGTYVFDNILFELNKAVLKKDSYPILDKIAAALNADPELKVEIQGHTDIYGAHDYNMGLSQRRADAVKTYLEDKGVDGARMTTMGFGPDQPIDTNKTKAGRARNRRVEFKPIQ